MTPAVAVITRSFDRPALLRRVMESVAGQSFADLVWVIVNDGAPAPVDAIAAEARELGVAVQLLHGTPAGPELAADRGIAASQSRYVVLHDDDDSWDAAFLARLVALLDQRPDLGGAISQSLRVEEDFEDGRATAPVVRSLRNDIDQVQALALGRPGLFPSISFLYRRDAGQSVGGYDIGMAGCGAWDFQLRFFERFTIGVVDQPLAFQHWRRNLPAGDRYANGSRDRVRVFASVVANRRLRADLRDGRLGMGSLAALARLYGDLDDQASNLEGALIAALRSNG